MASLSILKQLQSKAGQASQLLSKHGTANYKQVKDRMAKFVIQQGLPFNHFDNTRLTRLIRETLQPSYTHVSRTTLRNYCIKMWKKTKKELIIFFENLNTGVNLTSDVWSAPHGLPESYLCVTAHWVDPGTWQMMKRTIAFELFPYPHGGEDLFQILDYVITSYKLENKIFSMSFDNASNNTSAVDKLKVKYQPICNDAFFHTRCCTHIINLVVQDGLSSSDVITFITGFRVMLHSIFKASRKRYMEYKKYCKDTGRPNLGPNWDVPTRWNSTCTMLESAIRQRTTLEAFHSNLYDNGLVEQFSPLCWTNIEGLADFLSVFKTSTTRLSGVYYPTSPLVLSELYLMTLNFSNFELKNKMFEDIIVPMKKKFRKYFAQIPPIFSCAAALNPILNVTGVECAITAINDNLHMWEEEPSWKDETINLFKLNLQYMYDFYLNKYGQNIRMPTPGGVVLEPTNPSRSRSGMMNFLNTVRNETAKRQRGNTTSSELDRYMGTDYLATIEDVDNFDILAWWKGKESDFPILAAMARDLLTAQASTVASESVFSVSGRVLSLRRTRLTPEALETCICLKDHLDGIDRIQHAKSLEDEIALETQLHEEEVEEGMSTGISDEEIEAENLYHSGR